jgi:cation diffusion facilitator CzcD-associated flavoprotein CzcO
MDEGDVAVEFHEVIIIGAGVAGLAAAHALRHTHNIKDVLVLEARERTGRRPKGKANSHGLTEW